MLCAVKGTGRSIRWARRLCGALCAVGWYIHSYKYTHLDRPDLAEEGVGLGLVHEVNGPNSVLPHQGDQRLQLACRLEEELQPHDDEKMVPCSVVCVCGWSVSERCVRSRRWNRGGKRGVDRRASIDRSILRMAPASIRSGHWSSTPCRRTQRLMDWSIDPYLFVACVEARGTWPWLLRSSRQFILACLCFVSLDRTDLSVNQVADRFDSSYRLNGA